MLGQAEAALAVEALGGEVRLGLGVGEDELSNNVDVEIDRYYGAFSAACTGKLRFQKLPENLYFGPTKAPTESFPTESMSIITGPHSHQQKT